MVRSDRTAHEQATHTCLDRHPCIVQTLGFSRPDPYQTFLVQDWKDAVDGKYIVQSNVLYLLTVRLGDCLTDTLQRLQGKAWMKYVYQCVSNEERAACRAYSG